MKSKKNVRKSVLFQNICIIFRLICFANNWIVSFYQITDMKFIDGHVDWEIKKNYLGEGKENFSI